MVSTLQRSTQLSVADGVERFLLALASRNLAPKTLVWYKDRLKRFEEFLQKQDGAGLLQDIAERDLQEFLSELSQKQRKQGRSDYTVKKTYDALNTFFGYLHRENVVYVNPMANVQSPRTSKRLLHPLTQEEVTALLAAPNKKNFCGFRDYVLLVLFVDTGLRLNEALTLKVQDVNLQDATLLVFGKGRKERKVPFGMTLKNVLSSYLQT